MTQPVHSERTRERLTAAYLFVSALLAGASVMVLEMTASRVLAPAFGNTIFCWTGVIGGILAALAVGYYLGGWLADRNPRFSMYLHVLAAAAVAVALIRVAEPIVLSALSHRLDERSGPVVVGALLFGLPSVILGSVGPFAVRLASTSLTHVGRASGTISMLSALGSIGGTFAAGFVLIPAMGTGAVFTSVAMVLGGLSLVGYVLAWRQSDATERRAATVMAIACVITPAVSLAAGPPSDPTELYREDTQYQRIRVLEWDSRGEKVWVLQLDNQVNGGRYVNRPGLYLAYQPYYRLADVYTDRLESALFVGGGGYSLPIAMRNEHLGARVRVVEIDPRVHEIGRRYFGLDSNPEIDTAVGDGRRYLALHDDTYDLIFGDAYNAFNTIPFHLATQEFFELVRSRLNPGGVFMLNMHGVLVGPRSRYLMSILATLHEVFPHVHVYRHMQGRWPVEKAQNLILVARNAPDEVTMGELLRRAGRSPRSAEIHQLLSKREAVQFEPQYAQVLTDKHAPVEYLVSRMLDD